jgi:hypothetical protein
MANTLKFGNGQWATKVGSTLAYNDEGGNFKPLPFNFTRSTGGTRVNKDGLIEVITNNKPRIDFLNDSNGALLLEPQRTNLALRSEEINNTGFWELTNSGTITANSTISPDGYQNADTLNAGAAFSQVQGTILGTSGAVYTVSIWVKRITGTGNVFLRAVENANTLIAVTSDWQRFTATVTSTTTTIRIGINLATSGDAVAVWGGQIEAGSYATSYIPTQGATATRVVEVCSQTPPSGIIGQTEGVMFVDFNFTGGYDTSGIIPIVIRSGTNSAYIFINVSGTLNCDFFDSNVLQARLTTNIGISGRKKIAFAYKQNDFVAYMNGVQIGTDTNGTVGAMGILNVGSYYTGGYSTIGGVNQSQLYNTRLSNEELAALTTI